MNNKKEKGCFSLVFSILTGLAGAVLSFQYPLAPNEYLEQYVFKYIIISKIEYFLFMLSIYLLITYSLTLILNYSPLNKCLNNIIENTILHTTIILCAYVSIKNNDYTPTVFKYMQLYILGRIIFLITYLYGTYKGYEAFRSFGFGVGFAAQIGVLLIATKPYLNYNFFRSISFNKLL